jgi:hypothetical protein
MFFVHTPYRAIKLGQFPKKFDIIPEFKRGADPCQMTGAPPKNGLFFSLSFP